MNVTDLADKSIDIIRSYAEAKVTPLKAEIASLQLELASRITKAEAEENLRSALKDYAAFDPAALDAKLEEIKASIPEAIQGPAGENAPPLEVLSEGVDKTTQLPIGTLAAFDGGLWKSVAGSDGTPAWACLVDGIKNIQINALSERDISVIVERTSGASEEKKFSVPAMVYQGVYTDGKEYQKGDTVTAKGSLWHCNETTSEKPGDSKAWTLAAKRGQDAKGA